MVLHEFKKQRGIFNWNDIVTNIDLIVIMAGIGIYIHCFM